MSKPEVTMLRKNLSGCYEGIVTSTNSTQQQIDSMYRERKYSYSSLIVKKREMLHGIHKLKSTNGFPQKISDFFVQDWLFRVYCPGCAIFHPICYISIYIDEMTIKRDSSSRVVHESALWPAALWWWASGQELAIKSPAGFCGPGEVWHLGGFFSVFFPFHPSVPIASAAVIRFRPTC